ncbi:MAG: RluA family pseudouridine synthase [Candidatus Omnitrophica bacterium]|nr:RluA family pseudouridine synthase [Candidatus Omnitrophota bacterium]
MPVFTFIADATQDQNRLDVYVVARLADGQSRAFVQKLIAAGHVTANGKIVKSNYQVCPGDNICVDLPADFLKPPEALAQDLPLDIFYEDEYLFVINKPSGMVVHPAKGSPNGTLVNALLHHAKTLSDCNDDVIRPGIVHRLDKETSGLILIAKDNITHARLARLFERHEIRKHYVALVEGEVSFDQGRIDAALGRHIRDFEKKAVCLDDPKAKAALTYYQVIKRFPDATLISLFPRTGRTHQLRVHMAYLKHPILGDDKYGHPHNFPRLALHAKAIGFKHPHTRQWVEFSSRTPAEFLKRVGC